MTREEFVLNAIRDQGYTLKSFSDKIDMRYTTLLSILKGSLGGAAVDRVSKICHGIGISIDDLVSLDDENNQSSITINEISILALYKNADSRAQQDALMILKAHPVIDASSENTIMEAARHVIEKAKAQNGITDSHKAAK
jgi:repressor LexA